ncbi:MAG: TIGR03435 family protein [Verrucomicrobiota bacterium]|jgi:uncharacterized protein (TIGR03435 family)
MDREKTSVRRAFTLIGLLVLMVSIGIVAVVATAIVVKTGFSPAVQDSDFQLNYLHFQAVPKNLLVVRPTHFTNDTGSYISSTSSKVGQNMVRMMGRNVPLEQVMAAAYGCNPSRVVPPLIKPKGDFDYLVTLPDRQRERLQAAVKKKLGYIAHWENRDTDVLLLETITPDPPAFKLSTATKENVSFANRKYRFTHMQPTFMLGFLESNFKQPVVDRTGLTNFYDFTIAMNWHGPNGPDQQQLKSLLGNLGLKLEPTTESTRMLVVEETR